MSEPTPLARCTVPTTTFDPGRGIPASRAMSGEDGPFHCDKRAVRERLTVSGTWEATCADHLDGFPADRQRPITADGQIGHEPRENGSTGGDRG